MRIGRSRQRASIRRDSRPPVTRGLRESAAIAARACSRWSLFVALATYSPDDPGFSFTRRIGGRSSNRIGPVGAWLADMLFFLFGRPAFLFPVMLGVWCWTLFRNRKSRASAARAPTPRCASAGFVLVLVASCGLATLHWEPGALRQTAGGVVGKLVGQGLAAGLQFLGATLLLLAAWMAGAVARVRRLLAHGDGPHRRTAPGTASAWLRERVATRRDVAEGRERKQARMEVVEDGAEEVRHARAAAHRAAPRRWSRRASGWRRSGRCRCSSRRRRASCRR